MDIDIDIDVKNRCNNNVVKISNTALPAFPLQVPPPALHVLLDHTLDQLVLSR